MKRLLTLVLVAVVAIGSASAWGRLGHATVAKIAENHLTKRAKKQIAEYMHGESIVKWASYADDCKPELLVDLGFEPSNAKRFITYSALKLTELDGTPEISVTHPGITFTGITSHYPKLIFALIKHPMKIIFMRREKAALSILKGVFDNTKPYEWIGPRLFNVWGLPTKKALKTADSSEIEFIFEEAEKIYSSLTKN